MLCRELAKNEKKTSAQFSIDILCQFSVHIFSLSQCRCKYLLKYHTSRAFIHSHKSNHIGTHTNICTHTTNRHACTHGHVILLLFCMGRQAYLSPWIHLKEPYGRHDHAFETRFSLRLWNGYYHDACMDILYTILYIIMDGLFSLFAFIIVKV